MEITSISPDGRFIGQYDLGYGLSESRFVARGEMHYNTYVIFGNTESQNRRRQCQRHTEPDKNSLQQKNYQQTNHECDRHRPGAPQTLFS